MQEHVLKTITVQLRLSASAPDIDRLRKVLSEKLNLSVRGLAIDCRDADLNDAAVEMLWGLTKVAKDDGKRLTLIKLSAQAKQAVEQNRSRFPLDVFGEPIEQRTPEKPKRTWKDFRKSARRVMIPVLLAMPPVIGLEYYLFQADTSGRNPSVKSFESTTEDRFVVAGIVDVILDGKRRPDRGAIVVAWVNDVNISKDESPAASPAWITYADSTGYFHLPIKNQDDVEFLSVRITVMSEALDATKSGSDRYTPAAARPNEYHPTRQTQTYEYVIESGKPVRMNLLFF